MSNHYAIEMSMMLYQKDEWKVAFTYYNHGEEPPYGGIKSDEMPEDFVMSLDKFEANIIAVDEFLQKVRGAVKSIKPIPFNPVPDCPLEYGLEPKAGSIDYNIEMESMQLTVIYDKTTKKITFSSRPAYDISWQGFLFFQETIKDLLAEIEK